MTEFFQQHPLVAFAVALVVYVAGVFVASRVLRVCDNEIQQDFEELKDRHG